DIAEAIVAMHATKGGLFTKEDIANYHGKWEEPLTGSYENYTFFANGTWCQGAVLPMTLQILEGIDLLSMGHNSPLYMHTVLQAIELAMADKETYFGDPDFIDVPMTGLLSKEYAASRRSQMTNVAFNEMAPYGNPINFQDVRYVPQVSDVDVAVYKNNRKEISIGKDTSYISIIDQAGNAVSLTPSDFPQSPMVDGLGLTLGNRMTQFRLDATHPNALEPGKRPTITPNASMVFKDGEFYMTFGTPGGDMQTQALVQVFLNHIIFGMDIQEAIEAPRFRSLNWPDSFSPHEYHPGTIILEESLYQTHRQAMINLGYRVEVEEEWAPEFGGVCAIIQDTLNNLLIGGADPRQESLAKGK
ncbi:MAG: gamma-glutamyltransferase, partial [Bacilli bacterium]|nr:gamma-glutamyltransferase [Bacilli bacterium]